MHAPQHKHNAARVALRLGGWRYVLLLTAALCAKATTSPREAAADEVGTPPVGSASRFETRTPESVADLVAIENRVKAIVEKATQATVAVAIGRAQGSGVIVSEDGYVLTAAHVSRTPGRKVTIVLSDGRRVNGKTLGLNRLLDAGLIKITDNGTWPFAEIGDTSTVVPGNWCIATGHPSGYHEGRLPVVRLGRILAIRDTAIQTDCTLIGGDSGGPLFDMQGTVIGVHSRIGAPSTWNFHIPASRYSNHWERLVSAELWDDGPVVGEARLGVRGEDHPRGCRITKVPEKLPAKKAGLRVGDVIVALNGEQIQGFDDLAENVRSKRPGEKVALQVVRGDQTLQLEVALAGRR